MIIYYQESSNKECKTNSGFDMRCRKTGGHARSLHIVTAHINLWLISK